MQKIKITPFKENTYIKVICIITDVLAILYGGTYFYWMARRNSMVYENELTNFFAFFNPMTYGSYFLGITLLFHCYVLKNNFGKVIIGLLYVGSAIASLIAVMGMTGWTDLLMYVPHLFIIIAVSWVLYEKKDTSETVH